MWRVASQQLSAEASTCRFEPPLFSLAAAGSLTTCSRAGGCAWFNYPFLTQKERDIETGLDYFGARYYSSTQGRFTSPDEFTGGPHEIFGEVLGPTPLLYAEPTEPQSLNKYNYCLGNPLRYVDPDGHQTKQADALIVLPPETSLNVVIGAGKAIANIGIGISNFMGDKVAPYQPENLTQAVTMVVVEDVSVFAAFLGGRGPAGVMTAQTKQTGAVAAEVGGARGVAAEASAAERTVATVPYSRPSGATTAAQRASVQGKPCALCGESAPKMNAGHKEALVKEHYQTGTINRTRMRDPAAVRPECPTCSNREGANMSRYSRVMKNQIPQ
jgi:RHS repeat-associated protein